MEVPATACLLFPFPASYFLSLSSISSPRLLCFPDQAILSQRKMLFHHAKDLKSKMLIKRHIIRIMGFQGYHKLVLVGITDNLT